MQHRENIRIFIRTPWYAKGVLIVLEDYNNIGNPII
ncbi:MAG: hypothetical protein A4E38_01187 [Methanoregulaceae archaeon PtaB.Bin108]|jgi:hypothetical protein|nr:MAG: hypothetical protein A4E38_01187 [Methanoregulaceae archaeon PtaB.Bin108]OPY40913.1 MAG: hypothetical protein A4E42_01986 [Methanoregulaceae archaeon PtaU1.Bin222]